MFKVKKTTFTSQKSQSTTSQSSNTENESENIPLGQGQRVQVIILLRKSINLRRHVKQHVKFCRLLLTMTRTYSLNQVKNRLYRSMN